MSTAEIDDIETCPECSADINWLRFKPLKFTAGGHPTETIRCQQCGTTIQQTWTLTGREVVTE